MLQVAPYLELYKSIPSYPIYSQTLDSLIVASSSLLEQERTNPRIQDPSPRFQGPGSIWPSWPNLAVMAQSGRHGSIWTQSWILTWTQSWILTWTQSWSKPRPGQGSGDRTWPDGAVTEHGQMER